MKQYPDTLSRCKQQKVYIISIHNTKQHKMQKHKYTHHQNRKQDKNYSISKTIKIVTQVRKSSWLANISEMKMVIF